MQSHIQLLFSLFVISVNKETEYFPDLRHCQDPSSLQIEMYELIPPLYQTTNVFIPGLFCTDVPQRTHVLHTISVIHTDLFDFAFTRKLIWVQYLLVVPQDDDDVGRDGTVRRCCFTGDDLCLHLELLAALFAVGKLKQR